MFGIDYSRITLSVAFHHGVSANDVNMHSTEGITVDLQVMYNNAKVLLLDGRYRMEVMLQLHEICDVKWIQQHIQVRPIIREDKVSFSEI